MKGRKGRHWSAHAGNLVWAPPTQWSAHGRRYFGKNEVQNTNVRLKVGFNNFVFFEIGTVTDSHYTLPHFAQSSYWHANTWTLQLNPPKHEKLEKNSTLVAAPFCSPYPRRPI